MARKSPQQTPLLDPAPPANPVELVKVQSTAAPLGKAQKTFNRLTRAIRKLRDELAAWDDYLLRLQTRVGAELMPAEREIREVELRLVERLDQLLSSPGKGERLGKRQRATAVDQLLGLIENLLEAGPDPALETIHDRYSETSLAQLREEQLNHTKAFLDDLLGDDVLQGEDADSLDELLAKARAKAEALDAAEQAKQAKRKAKRGDAPSKAEQAAARKEQARIDALQSVRDVFRKLASALHPDREPDLTERERKTALMQRVNQAYERNDLLALLALQIEIEQIDSDHLSGLPEERLHHYNEVLTEQRRALERELAERLLPVKAEFDLPPWGNITTRHVDAAFDDQLAEAHGFLAQLQSDLQDLDDPRRRRELFESLAEPEIDEFDVFAFMREFPEAFDTLPVKAKPKKGSGKKKKG